MKRFLCRVLINEEYFPMVSKGESIKEARSHLINTYHLDRKQIIDICLKSEVQTYTPSYIGGNSILRVGKGNRSSRRGSFEC